MWAAVWAAVWAVTRAAALPATRAATPRAAVRATMRALRAGGAEPVAIGALLVLGTAVREVAGGLPVVAVATGSNPLWTPADCPLCAAGTPLDT